MLPHRTNMGGPSTHGQRNKVMQHCMFIHLCSVTVLRLMLGAGMGCCRCCCCRCADQQPAAALFRHAAQLFTSLNLTSHVVKSFRMPKTSRGALVFLQTIPVSPHLPRSHH